MKLEARMSKLEDAFTQHIKESGAIQANIKWNTWLTGIILIAIIGSYFHK